MLLLLTLLIIKTTTKIQAVKIAVPTASNRKSVWCGSDVINCSKIPINIINH